MRSSYWSSDVCSSDQAAAEIATVCAIDVDGTGLGVTTEQCLLNPNRNPGLARSEIEARLSDDLGIDRILWLGEGLVNDHTDGHVDNLARFVAEGVLAVPEGAGDDDPNAGILAVGRRRGVGRRSWRERVCT